MRLEEVTVSLRDGSTNLMSFMPLKVKLKLKQFLTNLIFALHKNASSNRPLI